MITRSVESAADSARILADKGARDAERPKSNPEDNLDEQVPSDTISGLRIGIPDNYFFEHVDTEVETAVRNAYEQLESLGARPVHIKIPFADKLMATEATIAMAEASAYHRRMLRESAELYTDGVRVLLEAGELISASDYLHAQRVRTLIQKAFHDMYEKIDVLVTPTVPAAAVTRNTDTITWRDGVCEPVLWAYTRYAVPANLTGLPALSMPCGFTTSGLPIGLQMIGRPFYESAMLNLGAAYEAATNWHKRYPPI